MKEKFLNVTNFAKLKKCSRQVIYDAERRGEIDIDRSPGGPIIYLNKKNLAWKLKVGGRPKKVKK